MLLLRRGSHLSPGEGRLGGGNSKEGEAQRSIKEIHHCRLVMVGWEGIRQLPGKNSSEGRQCQTDKVGQARRPQFLEGWFNAELRVVSGFRCAFQPNHMWPIKVRSGYN